MSIFHMSKSSNREKSAEKNGNEIGNGKNAYRNGNLFLKILKKPIMIIGASMSILLSGCAIGVGRDNGKETKVVVDYLPSPAKIAPDSLKFHLEDYSGDTLPPVSTSINGRDVDVEVTEDSTGNYSGKAIVNLAPSDTGNVAVNISTEDASKDTSFASYGLETQANVSSSLGASDTVTLGPGSDLYSLRIESVEDSTVGFALLNPIGIEIGSFSMNAGESKLFYTDETGQQYVIALDSVNGTDVDYSVKAVVE